MSDLGQLLNEFQESINESVENYNIAVEALEFYANVENWISSQTGMTSIAQKECGAIARKALAKLRE